MTATYRNGDRVRVTNTASGLFDGVTGTIIRRSERSVDPWYWVELDKVAHTMHKSMHQWLSFEVSELEFEDNTRYLETYGDLLGRVGDYVLIPQYLTCEGIAVVDSDRVETTIIHHAFRLTAPLRYGQMTGINAECPDCTGEIDGIPRDHISRIMLMCDQPSLPELSAHGNVV